MAPRNLVNLESVSKAFGERPLLAGVSLGIAEGERIGIVGRNGAGKSTLLRVLGGLEPPDAGRVAVTAGTHLAVVSQADPLAAGLTIADAVVPGRDVHEWAGDPRIREVLTGLLGSFDEASLARPVGTLSGGERRRVQLARALVSDADLLLLDEPTNHLDVEVIAWLAAHLKARRLAVVVVTHDRWFLDEICDRTWEVVGGSVEEYDGGYSAYVLAKAERARQAAASEARRQNLLRKELAWLRRGAPARTSKPKFRIDAANALIEGEPPPRDGVELLSFAGARLGKTVVELHDASVSVPGPDGSPRTLLDRITLDIGPGERVGVLGPNGAGKTSLRRVLLGQAAPSAGRIVIGQTVKSAYLSQHLDELDPTMRVLQAVEDVAMRVDLGKGRELSASQLCERLGFGSDGQWTPVADLSGGERRRLQLTRLLMAGPNVLVLDEPTNDFDVETLAALEDLLDGFAGTLIVVSHDRYFLERTCDQFIAVMGDGRLTPLVRGIDEYLERRAQATPRSASSASGAESAPVTVARGGAAERELRKELQRLERAIAKADERIGGIHADLATAATDFARVSELDAELRALEADKDALESAWLEASEALSG